MYVLLRVSELPRVRKSSSDTYSSYGLIDEWIDANRNGNEPKAWTAERLKIYDSLEKARYKVNALETRSVRSKILRTAAAVQEISFGRRRRRRRRRR
jgi:hypothetical protein